jgi:hypothetical protein
VLLTLRSGISYAEWARQAETDWRVVMTAWDALYGSDGSDEDVPKMSG